MDEDVQPHWQCFLLDPRVTPMALDEQHIYGGKDVVTVQDLIQPVAHKRPVRFDDGVRESVVVYDEAWDLWYLVKDTLV